MDSYGKNTFNDMSTALTMFVAPSSVLTRSGLGAQRCRDAMTLHVPGAQVIGGWQAPFCAREAFSTLSFAMRVPKSLVLWFSSPNWLDEMKEPLAEITCQYLLLGCCSLAVVAMSTDHAMDFSFRPKVKVKIPYSSRRSQHGLWHSSASKGRTGDKSRWCLILYSDVTAACRGPIRVWDSLESACSAACTRVCDCSSGIPNRSFVLTPATGRSSLVELFEDL